MTAGIIAVVGAGNTIGKGLAKVIALRHAPDILLALNNEIIDLAYVVPDIDGLLKKEAEISGTTPPSSLHRALDNSRQNLTELEQLVLIELTTIKGKKNEAKLDRSVWLRTEPKVRELKDKIRDDRLRLSTALSVLASYVDSLTLWRERGLWRVY